MYDYIDQPVEQLDHGGRFLIWTMRQWVQSMHQRQCPVCVIGPAFVKWRMMAALAPFQTMMVTLNLHARNDISFAPNRCKVVSEDEAMLIALISHMPRRSAEDVTETLKMIITDDHVESLRTSLSAVSEIMAETGILPGKPVPVAR